VKNISRISLVPFTRLKAAAPRVMMVPAWVFQLPGHMWNYWVVKSGFLQNKARDRYSVLIFPIRDNNQGHQPGFIFTGHRTLSCNLLLVKCECQLIISDVNIEAWGTDNSNGNSCGEGIVYLNGQKVTLNLFPPGQYWIIVNEPGNITLFKKIIVK
jgi:hypothetical protein